MIHRFLSAIAACAIAFAGPPAIAQTSAPAAPAPAAALPDADPALWVVRDDDTTIYLFGTFHLLDGRPWFNDEVRTAFDASNELVLEAIIPENMAEMAPLIQRYAVYPEGQTLSQRLTPEQNAALGRVLTEAGVPAAAFDRMEPWFVSMTLGALAAQKLGIGPNNGPEGALSRAARERNIPIGELEGVTWQLQLFDRMPEAQQIAQLNEAVENFDQLDEELTPMLAAWSTGNVDELVRILSTQSDNDPELHRLLFTERNATWAGWIQERMARPGTVFLAVGAGHLAGGDSVQAVLATRGLHAERVPHTPAP